MKKTSKLLMVLSVGMLVAGCSCANGEPINTPKPSIEETSDTINLQKMYEESKLSTVGVYAQGYDNTISIGSGIVFKEEGKFAYILTNAHVLYSKDVSRLRDKEINIRFSNDKRIKAICLGVELNEDVGVLRIEKSDNYAVAKVVNSDLDTKIGELVYGIGMPEGDPFSLTQGYITQTRKNTSLSYIGGSEATTYVFNSTATLNHGNSGGPLFNSKGEVIAINSMYPQSDAFRNYNYSIPINHCIDVAKNIILKGSNSFVRPNIRLEYKSIADMSVSERDQNQIVNINKGLLVTRSDSITIKKDAVIIEVEGIEVSRVEDLEFIILTKFGTSDSVKLTITNKVGTNRKVETLNLR